MKKKLFHIAATCWVLSFTIHFLSLFKVNVQENFGIIWLLHLGIFFVFIPMLILQSKRNKQLLRENKKSEVTFFDEMFLGAPNWMKGIAIGGFFYAFLNFFIFMSNNEGTPSIQDGRYILSEQGRFLKEVTIEEYNSAKANEVRAFSGHWLLFYGIAATSFFKYSFPENNLKD